jgi:hypothetical protein
MVLIVGFLNDGVSSTKHGFYDSFEYTDVLYPNVELLVLSFVPNFFLFSLAQMDRICTPVSNMQE